MPITTVFNLFSKILIMVLLGFLLKRTSIVDNEFQKKLSNLLLNAILPISILSSANSEFSKALSGKLIQAAIISSFYYIIALAVMVTLSKYMILNKKKRSILITMSVFANTAFIGFPIVSELYGAEGTLYAVIYNLFYQVFLFTYGIMLLNNQEKFQWKSLYKDISTVISLIAIILYVSPIRYPNAIASAFDEIGGMVVPLSMIIIGCQLSNIKWKSLFNDKYSYFVSGVRLIIFPIVMLIVLKLLNVDMKLAATCTVLTALPAGSLNVILAEQYDCEPKFATQTVIQCMLFMLVSLPIIIFAIGKILY
ncbi:MAG: AEC family transporter [Herbinix sp.]|nr:AEC family transporter [Herbinix sp.]